MPFSPGGRRAALVLALALIATACGGGGGDGDAERVAGSSTSSSTTTTTAPPTTVPRGPVAPLTGLPVDDEAVLERPAIVVKISNNDDVSLEGLIGIEQADVVIEERIEDRATRFAAVFHSALPSVVGPVRSGRPADVDILANLGTPLLVFSGAHASVVAQLRAFANADGVVLIVDDASNVDLVRDPDYRRPDNLFVDLAAMLEKYGERAGTAKPIFEIAAAPVEGRAGEDGAGVTVRGRDIVAFVFDPDRGYVRVQDGAVHVTREGVPLVADNVVVMETPYTPSSYDNRNVDAATVGTGPVSVLVGGVRIAGTWERAAPEDPYTFRDADGDPILLDPGRTWLTLVPAGTYDFGVDAETSGLVLGAAG